MLVNFVISILLMLEPIKLSNLNEGKSPIDFDSFNGFETCDKTNWYDYYSCLNKIISYLNEVGKEEFIKEWSIQLEKDFHNKYMHFATRRNTNLITVRSLIINSYQNFDVEGVSGWIIFPIGFGLSKMPRVKVNHLTFPKSFDNYVNYAYSEGKNLRIMADYRGYGDDLIAFGILPFFNESNQSLFYSFYHLAVSFKYFVLFSQDIVDDEIKIKITKLIFDSIVACSPFFYTHSDTILPFLSSKFQVPFTKEYIKLFNIFSFSISHIKQKGVVQFLNQQASLANDIKSAKYRYFISDSEPVPSKHELPQPAIPLTLYKSNNNYTLLFAYIIRVLKHMDNNLNFPFHLILSEWTESFQMFPPCELNFVESNVVLITFISYIPKNFLFYDLDFSEIIELQISYKEDFSSSFRKSNTDNIKTNIKTNSLYELVTSETTNNKVYVKFLDHENISQHNFVIHTSCFNQKNEPNLSYECKSFFRNDLVQWREDFTENDDQQILKNYKIDHYQYNSINTRPNLAFVGSLNNRNHPTHLNYLRSIYLIAFNYLVFNDLNLMDVFGYDSLNRFYSLHFLSSRFMSQVEQTSRLNSNENIFMHINRQRGLDVRNGISNKVSDSLIGQFSYYYTRNPDKFRNIERPFKVCYDNESGVDAGGLMRDFISELMRDINEPKVGLFVQTPNGRNHEGKFQDCIIPSPSPVISRSDNYYRAFGALMGIAIRTGMKLVDLNFPPLFWRFIISGNLRIEDIYEVDKAYKTLITNISRAAVEMNDEEFQNSMASVTVMNIRGSPITLDRRSSFALRNLSRSNCERFVVMCNQSRINELLLPLQNIRNGLWDNLNFDVPLYATPYLIEFMACGEKFINPNELISKTIFYDIPLTQKRYFAEVVHRLTNDERQKLLYFSTGLTSLTREGLKVDFLSHREDSSLPTASTCFFSLHLPPFSSAERMYRAILIAINETGSFENS